MSIPVVISVLARSLLSGEQTVDGSRARAITTLGRQWTWLRPLAQRYITNFEGRTRPCHREVIQFLFDDAGFQNAVKRHRNELFIAEWFAEPQLMQPVAAAQPWKLPAIENVAALADWLSLHPAELEWFADLKMLGSKLEPFKLQHYHYKCIPKRSGGFRIIEIPKSYMKALQRRILSGILDGVPAHPAVHGFVKGRSIVTFASPHAGQKVLLRMDLQNFFPAFPVARVQALFRTLGYPEQVANRLGGICTNITPRAIWKGPAGGSEMVYSRPHLPQGAPGSPALANLMAHRLDCRLARLATSAAATYTRYADDLAFSGGEDFSRVVERFAIHAAAIALEEGLAVNHHKTRIMRQGTRQQLAGIVVNRKVGIRRTELERLEAILTNCARYGPAGQNRESVPDFRAHLQGRVSFVEMVDRTKGRRLRLIFDAIKFA